MGFGLAAEIHSLSWKNSCSFISCPGSVSFSLGLDHYRDFMLPEEGQKWGFLISLSILCFYITQPTDYT
ncbi:hypothetical protein RDI58_016245 [Solanum bulbocastanum]|uniref:Uncharacterized protein n=1 Tax=Solanum bulbocastanum TaxID=147425 RepID=A0AAN8YC78_SOLBU